MFCLCIDIGEYRSISAARSFRVLKVILIPQVVSQAVFLAVCPFKLLFISWDSLIKEIFVVLI